MCVEEISAAWLSHTDKHNCCCEERRASYTGAHEESIGTEALRHDGIEKYYLTKGNFVPCLSVPGVHDRWSVYECM